MSKLPKTPQKKKSHCKRIDISIREDNNNSKLQLSKQQLAKNFIAWYKSKIDNNLHNLNSYLSDDVTLEWFGRTIKTRKKVSAFMKTEIQCSQHDFTTVESIDRIHTRNESLQRKDCTSLLSPPHSPEVNSHEKLKSKKRKLQACRSPQWAEGSGPEGENGPHEKKRKLLQQNDVKDITVKISNKGDGLLDKSKSKNSSVTPPNMECGQGDCLPSTSGTNPETLHDILNPQLPKLAVECNGYIALTRTKHNWSVDCLKWDRKCKVQISYSEDPLNVGEYIIWNLRYSDESKCRRNLLSAFEEGASD